MEQMFIVQHEKQIYQEWLGTWGAYQGKLAKFQKKPPEARYLL